MSTYEYYDMFIDSQEKGQYHMFVFDIINSKKMDAKTRTLATLKMEQLMLKIYSDIKQIEIQKNKKILVINVDGIVPYEQREKSAYKPGLLYEPILYADTFAFTIYRDTITKEEIINIYNQNKTKLNIDFDFHISDGYYETNNYGEGGTLFFRRYCFDILSNYHKDYNKKLRKKMYNS